MFARISQATIRGMQNASLAPDPAIATPSPGAAVICHELSKRYGDGPTAVDALRDVTLELGRGTFTSIMGPSGSGKSTLLHLLAGLEHPTSGWVELAGTRLDDLSDRELTLLRRREVGFVFQRYNLLPVLTAEENVTLPVTIGGGTVDRQWLDTLFATTGIEHRRNHLPTEMSGGEQQRVAIARALITRPAVVFADEPTGNLDSAAGREILELLRGAVDEFGQTIVIVTHDPFAAAAADRLLFLVDGRVAADQQAPTVEGILDRLKAFQ
jgi:putative ABC transport system ATP-binding protein